MSPKVQVSFFADGEKDMGTSDVKGIAEVLGGEYTGTGSYLFPENMLEELVNNIAGYNVKALYSSASDIDTLPILSVKVDTICDNT